MNWLLLLAAEEMSRKEALVHAIAEYSHVGVFVVLVLCGLGLPIPEELVLAGGGYAVHQFGGDWPAVLVMILVAFTGVMVGDVSLWAIGRRVGNDPSRVPLIGRHLTRSRMRRARALFREHGAKAIFFGRFLFGIRAVTFFVSGSLRVPLTTFVLMDGLAALLHVPIAVILGWHFGDELGEAFSWLARLDGAFLAGVAVALAIFGYLIWRKTSRGRPPAPPPGSLPDDVDPLAANADDDGSSAPAADDEPSDEAAVPTTDSRPR